MPNLEFLKLPWEIQVALASGYAAYILAYIGLRERQRAIDIAFISLVFSLIASLMLWLLASHGPIISSIAAFLASIIAGLFWRKFDRFFIFSILRRATITGQTTSHPLLRAYVTIRATVLRKYPFN
jgi:Na+/proline symporter